jgi:hypothetical protein
VRYAACVLVLLSAEARAHVVPFDWLEPANAGNRSDAGAMTLAWVDGADPPGNAVITFYATRGAPRPFGFPAPDASVQLGTALVTDPTNVLDVDVGGLSAGCWAPYAIVTDPIDTGFHVGAGNFTVLDPDGGVPPSIWVTNNPRDGLDDAGYFQLRWQTDDDDPGAVTVRAYWGLGGAESLVLSSGLPSPAGPGTAQLNVDARRLPNATASFLQVELRAGDGRTCDAFFPGYLYPSFETPDAGADAGVDAGTDAGVVPPPPPRGCGCEAAGAPLWWLVAACWLGGCRGARRRAGSKSSAAVAMPPVPNAPAPAPAPAPDGVAREVVKEAANQQCALAGGR